MKKYRKIIKKSLENRIAKNGKRTTKAKHEKMKKSTKRKMVSELYRGLVAILNIMTVRFRPKQCDHRFFLNSYYSFFVCVSSRSSVFVFSYPFALFRICRALVCFVLFVLFCRFRYVRLVDLFVFIAVSVHSYVSVISSCVSLSLSLFLHLFVCVLFIFLFVFYFCIHL